MTYLYAEYENAHALALAIPRVREVGAAPLEAFMPYAAPEVERALSAPPSRLSIAVLAGGLGGAGGAYGLQWLLNAYLYPLDVGGRPPHFPLSFVPITFEMGVLFASFAAIGAVFVLGRLLRLWYRTNEVEGFESATDGRFWLEISAADPAFDLDRTRADLTETGAQRIELAEVGP